MKAMGHLCVCCKLYNLLSRKWQSGRSLRIYAWRGDASAGANLIAVAVEIAVQIEVAVRSYMEEMQWRYFKSVICVNRQNTASLI